MLIFELIKLVFKAFLWGALAVVLFMTVMAIINMSRLNSGQDPLWCIKSKVENTEKGVETIYDLGLYNIKKIEDETGVKTMVKPSFIKDF